MTIDGLYNFRDTGGMPLQGGGATRPGVLYRSDALSGLTPEGEQALAATAVGVILDFRTEGERTAAPDRIPASRPFAVSELSILEGAMGDAARQFASGGTPSPEAVATALAAMPSLGDLYLGMLQHGGASFAEVARRIAASHDDAPTGVLVHCTAGKDRTGVATALMLDAAGVERDAIVADYASSERNLAGPWADGMIHMLTSLGLPMTPELETLVTGTPPQAIETVLDRVDAEHSGSAGYLVASGLSEGDLTAMRARLRG